MAVPCSSYRDSFFGVQVSASVLRHVRIVDRQAQFGPILWIDEEVSTLAVLIVLPFADIVPSKSLPCPLLGERRTRNHPHHTVLGHQMRDLGNFALNYAPGIV
jgi:hypothetical protein